MINTAYITIDGKRLSTQLLGEGETLIVLLHGAGVLAPVLEFRALSDRLAKNYKVLVIENFGYGFSDCTDKERTIEQITCELHEAIASTGYSSYVLMGHSISGVYSLYYSNQYPKEVLAFIGIDPSVPRQIDAGYIQKINLLALRFTRFLSKSGLLKRMTSRLSNFLPSIQGVCWSEEEIAYFKKLYLNNNSNATVFNELQNMTRNFRKAYSMRFPDTAPTLFFLSEKTCRQLKNWKQIHQELINPQNGSRMILYDGTHFLHYSHASQIADESDKWLRSVSHR